MSAPLEFIKVFAGKMRDAGIEHALTSGMACVHYGLQQTTKDSDWIVPAGRLARLRALLGGLEEGWPPWRISYRQICGAPMEEEYLRHGWTSHLSIWDSASSVEHKVDLFSAPPRVRLDELEIDAEGWASRHVVAQMKKTDRDKDWPMVGGLGRQLAERRESTALLHAREHALLLNAWAAASPEQRLGAVRRRPLVKVLDRPTPPDRLALGRLLAIERTIWEQVNDHRHSRYTRAWKQFFRNWRRDEEWQWPTAESFAKQHRRLCEAAGRHGLPLDPLEGNVRAEVLSTALTEAAALSSATPEEMAQVQPPMEEMLP